MTLRFAAIALSLLAVPACADHADTPVVDLSRSDKVELCESFRATVCGDGLDWSGCDCNFCGDSSAPTRIDEECGAADATRGQVDECAAAFAEDVETGAAVCLQGGGCMFDVGDDGCPSSAR